MSATQILDQLPKLKPADLELVYRRAAVLHRACKAKPRRKLLSWEETAKAMAAAKEDWSEWDSVAGDGINGL